MLKYKCYRSMLWLMYMLTLYTGIIITLYAKNHNFHELFKVNVNVNVNVNFNVNVNVNVVNVNVNVKIISELTQSLTNIIIKYNIFKKWTNFLNIE